MRILFLVSGGAWSASARAFLVAAKGLSQRGHDIVIACESDCPVHVHAQTTELPIVPLRTRASGTAAGWHLRDTIRERAVDVVFVHTDAEQYVAGSAVRFARGAACVIRRIPPFAVATRSRRGTFASRLAPTALLFTTDADREGGADQGGTIPTAVAPLAVDLALHDSIVPAERAMLGATANARVVVCIQDGRHPQRVLSAIRSLSMLASRHPELHLVVLGTGDLDELRMHGAALGISAMITYLGIRDDELSIIRAADVGWIAGEGDAAAFAALDCMAFGVPIVAERTPLTEHYVADGSAGILLASDDATETAASVAAFLAKRELSAQMGQAGRVRLQREFSFDAMIAGFEAAMRATASAARR
ncbi:MAG TPA: glycosyltransferase family 4 protein [Gemmatimonadaceae bacterium]|nr:glycosyltransferase family 4 protein [Gemmatimonadaceae bacterium]